MNIRTRKLNNKLYYIITLALLCLLLPGCGRRDLSMYDHLKDPQIRTIPRQKMLEVQLKGDPNTTTGKAFGLLYKAAYKLKKKENFEMMPPRARWPKSVETPKEEWEGVFGIPIPEVVTSLPDQKPDAEVQIKIAYWEYGEIAEILHVGPYSEEPETIKKLHALISEKGYYISGDHEEEYLKGPGMFLKGNPKKYKTIIRYPVKKEAVPADSMPQSAEVEG